MSLLTRFLVLRVQDHRGRKVMPARYSHRVTGREKAICFSLFIGGLVPFIVVMSFLPHLGLRFVPSFVQQSWWWSTVMVLGGTLAGFFFEERFFWRRFSTPALLRKCECAACEYALGELPPEPDGCTVCPECGAAWRLGKARRRQATKARRGEANRIHVCRCCGRVCAMIGEGGRRSVGAALRIRLAP